ncbi:LOW QUALITY PROTEIN: hypothetical protein ACHAW6_002749 [Cyclotella cf. meneghiniana]
MEEHAKLIKYYNLPKLYLGSIAQHPVLSELILKDGGIHVNNIGSFLVRRAMGIFLRSVEYLFHALKDKKCGVGDFYQLPPPLFEPTEIFDWVMNFDRDAKGWEVHDADKFLEICVPSVKSYFSSGSSTIEHVNVNKICSKYISGGMQSHTSEEHIGCEECPNPSFNLVEDIGGGWTWCGSPWPAVCKPNGIHHHNCSSSKRTGIAAQTFRLDNRETDDLHANHSRELNLFIRVLKGYDDDFGQALVIAWAHESKVPKLVAALIDTKWKQGATVLNDEAVTVSLQIPPPNEQQKISITAAIIPLKPSDISQNVTSSAKNINRCRLYFNSILVVQWKELIRESEYAFGSFLGCLSHSN